MKLLSFPVLAPLFLVGLVAAPLCLANSPQGPGQGQGPGPQGQPGGPGEGRRGGREEGGLEGDMKALQMNMKRLGGALEKNDMEGVLACVLDMQRAAANAKTQTPPMVEKLQDAAKKKEMLLGYRHQMIELERALLDVEVAAIDGKADEVKKLLQEKVRLVRDSGHEKYNPEDDHKRGPGGPGGKGGDRKGGPEGKGEGKPK